MFLFPRIGMKPKKVKGMSLWLLSTPKSVIAYQTFATVLFSLAGVIHDLEIWIYFDPEYLKWDGTNITDEPQAGLSPESIGQSEPRFGLTELILSSSNIVSFNLLGHSLTIIRFLTTLTVLPSNWPWRIAYVSFLYKQNTIIQYNIYACLRFWICLIQMIVV